MFKDHAHKYYNNGLHVIPLDAVTKRPAISQQYDREKKKWTDFTEDDFLDRYSEWEEKLPYAGIGLCCGEINGIIALDIDMPNDFYIRKNITLPFSAVSKIGNPKKNATMFFKYEGQQNKKLHEIGIEVLSNGFQTVVPPSIHPVTMESYKWTSTSIFDVEIDDLPSLIIDPKWEKLNDSLKTEHARKGAKGSTGRQTQLFNMACAKAGQRVHIDQAVSELINHDSANHNPPWFSDLTQGHNGNVIEVATALYKRALIKESEKLNSLPVIKEKPVIEKEKKVIKSNKKELTQFPEPTYFIKVIVDHIKEVSYKERESFSIASAVSLIATLASNKYAYKGTYTNLYQFLIADSGSGKDTPLKYPKQLMNYCGVRAYNGLSTYRSDKAIIQELITQRSRLDIIDEVSKLFKAANGNSGQLTLAIEALNELWSSSGMEYAGQMAGGITTGFCHSPCVNLIGAMTPDAFTENVKEGNLKQGLGSRGLFIVDNGKVKIKRESQVKNLGESLPKELEEFIKEIGNKKPHTRTLDLIGQGLKTKRSTEKGGEAIFEIKSVEIPMPYLIIPNKDAFELIDSLAPMYDELSYKCDESVRPLMQRATQQIKKIAIVHYVSRIHYEKHVMSISPRMELILEDVKFGIDYMNAAISQSQEFFRENLFVSEFQQECARIKRIIGHMDDFKQQQWFTKKLKNKFKSSKLYGPLSRQGIIGGLFGELIESGDMIHRVIDLEKTKANEFKLV